MKPFDTVGQRGWSHGRKLCLVVMPPLGGLVSGDERQGIKTLVYIGWYGRSKTPENQVGDGVVPRPSCTVSGSDNLIAARILCLIK